MMEAIKINPQFDDLQKAETLVNHVQELTKPKVTPHADILSKLLEQFEPLDFETMANPKEIENFRISNKHFTVLSVENALQVAIKNRWGLCKNHDFIYLYNGTFWSQLDKETFQKFLGESAEKMGVPKFTARYYEYREKLNKQFLAAAYLPTPETDKNTVLINLQNGTFEINEKGTSLRSFDSKDFITYQLPFEYNPQATAPMFEAYLNRVLPDKERQRILAEYLDWSNLSRSRKYE
jgi:putative DNA primase/helicase